MPNELSAKTSGFLTLGNTDFKEAIIENLNGLDQSPDRIKIPSGGSILYEVPGEGDEVENVKEFSGVILFHHPLNAYYKVKYSGGSNPPDCGSFDGKYGTKAPSDGIPLSRECAKCPHNQYGSGENGSKACQNRRRVFVLREGEVFPMLFSLPPASLKTFTKYIKIQLSKGRLPSSIVTKFSLKKATSKGGIAYSQAVFSFDRMLSPEEFELIKPISEQMKTYSMNALYDGESADGYSENYLASPKTGEVIQPL